MADRRSSLTIVLAAGEGTRMRGSLPKALHEIAGQTLLSHVLGAVPQGEDASVAVVVGPDHDAVAQEARRARPDGSVFVQKERRGTAHAVLAAREAILNRVNDIIVAFGDTPLITPETFERMRAPLRDGAALVVLGFRAADPTGYGRLIVQGERLLAIREQSDASEAERAITLCNAGVMAFDGQSALSLIEAIGNANSKGEFYLTDAVEIARARGLDARVIVADEDEVRGINTKAQLSEAEQIMQTRLRRAAMRDGVTLVAPETVYLAKDTSFGRDVVVEPFVVFGRGVKVGDGAVIHAFSHVAGAEVGPEASVGPYARLRPGTVLGEGARVGNFVEVKASTLAAGSKANHLSYIGDSSVGAHANIGAGTITCNYDGFGKHRTTIGAGAFIGSNSALVAPVTVGAGAYVGSGSVITRDVADDALAIGRGTQIEREGWAKRFRQEKSPKPPDRASPLTLSQSAIIIE